MKLKKIIILIVTFLDLKNAFCDVHHNLISSVLSYHHVPESVQCLFSNRYTKFKISIITDHYRSPAIPVCSGVLQGDCLIPLLFNICFNTFIKFIKAEKFKQLGFSTHEILTACSIQYTGFNSLMMLLLLQVERKTINCC